MRQLDNEDFLTEEGLKKTIEEWELFKLFIFLFDNRVANLELLDHHEMVKAAVKVVFGNFNDQ